MAEKRAAMSADEVIRALGLAPLPKEGGFYRETYRSEASLGAGALPPAFGGAAAGPRSVATAIYYLLTPETFSALHRLRADEVYHHYLGDPVELRQLEEDGTARRVLLGSDLAAGERPQALVRARVWQGSRLAAPRAGAWALLGTTMAPGFDFADYEHGEREALCARYPQHASWIRELATG